MLFRSVPEAKAAIQHITYNIHGPNARVNQNSTDNSINVVQIDARVSQYIEDLRKEIDESSLPATEKADAKDVITEVDSAVRSGKSSVVVAALLSALPRVANVATIVTLILRLLGKA